MFVNLKKSFQSLFEVYVKVTHESESLISAGEKNLTRACQITMQTVEELIDLRPGFNTVDHGVRCDWLTGPDFLGSSLNNKCFFFSSSGNSYHY